MVRGKIVRNCCHHHWWGIADFPSARERITGLWANARIGDEFPYTVLCGGLF
jgi:hypothetical protein